jgi:hypothetical protein
LLRIKTWFQNKEQLSGLILPAPAQKDGWMGGASFDTKNVLGVKPNLNIQRLPDLLPPPHVKLTDGSAARRGTSKTF